MGKPGYTMSLLVMVLVGLMATQANALMPYTRSLWDIMLPSEDPFRILEQTPLTIPKGIENLALARADWKETPTAHVITLDIPGINKDDINLEKKGHRFFACGPGATPKRNASLVEQVFFFFFLSKSLVEH